MKQFMIIKKVIDIYTNYYIRKRFKNIDID